MPSITKYKNDSMADKIKKLLDKLTLQEREIVKLLILRVKLNDVLGLNIKQLKGHTDLFRVRKGRLRIVYRKAPDQFLIVRIDR
jgi:mRNA-degrading endonuclease RelE of RelBE toxin-antitoxin system